MSGVSIRNDLSASAMSVVALVANATSVDGDDHPHVRTCTRARVSDPIPTNTTFLAGQYTGARDVSVQVGATTTFCIAEAGGTDSNADGCVRTVGGALSVGAPAVTNVAQGSPVIVNFRVTIN